MITISKSINCKQVLIVDDERNLLQLLTMLLETRGYEVEVAHTGSEALRKVSPHIDLIILDLVLPDIDGFEVCRLLKRRKATAHIPIILLSAQDMNENKVEGLYLGADDFLAKPCDIEELFARMEAVMRRGRTLGSQRTYNYENETIIELRKILDQELIIPFFQPIYHFKPFRLLGLEVLSRPVSNGKLSNPEHFFKSALQFGLYQEMELLSWTKAIDVISDLPYEHHIFLNCNPFLVEGSEFDKIKFIFDNSKVSPTNVILEITERSAISDSKLFYQNIQKFRNYGFRFAIDDLGGGYASLESIVQTKPDVVKIDRHIISDLKYDSFKRSIVKFIVAFCAENQIEVIAEGIETKDDLETVIDLGVNAGQGFFLYEPTAKVNLEEIQNIHPTKK